MTEKYSTKNYKPGYSPSRLQHNYKMTYENAYNLAQDLNDVFNRLYMVEQEKKEYRKETERLQKELAEAIEQNQINVYKVAAQAARGANYALKEVKKLEAENDRLREALEEIKKTVEDAQDTIYPFHIALDSKDAVYILEVTKEALKGDKE